ncbi:peamaclein-like [Triticum dicoccoides]|uniref:peamaclein-like n=1 Tax=Triticum dicoccoides TaxID=85692 RepID=UPI000E78ADF7|nr:peamaclein-like [Triticum dicoccoides]
MAYSKPVIILAALLLTAIVIATDAQSTLQIDCPSACNARCSKNWRNKICNKDCNICCEKCNCVPSGTGQETRNECPCYANLVDSKTGKLKCP